MTVLDLPLPDLLREARGRVRMSQWDLALGLGVSQRHVSFVELGRSRPSRPLLLRWLDHLGAPLVLRNEALQAAGYAPAFDDSAWSDDLLGEAHRAASHLLRSHEPWPALLLDSRWDVLAANSGVPWLLDAVGSDVTAPGVDGAPAGTAPVNLLDLAMGDLGAAIVNLEEVAASLMDQLRHEMATEPTLRPRVEALEALVPATAAPVRFPPTLTTRYATRAGELAFLSMFTTFGAPHSVTLASLRIELMFPADEFTRSVLTRA
ncbi:MAG: helix-turn-helix domain-containing protein [Propionibacteriales bacterium]|nr:helix-turn-helix domain-containing protein [Propionibacteriales bacterium]